MTLKELRISKGLSQAECAAFLGMSTRNYQNYENYKGEKYSAKYFSIFNKLSSYGDNDSKKNNIKDENSEFNTNVILNHELENITDKVKNYRKRECYSIIRKYITSDKIFGKILILYGLRRTGKTTLLFQAINELPIDKTAYIKVRTEDNMSMLTKDLHSLTGMGKKYIFIDEITLLSDFINTASILSDIFSMMGIKIIVSGTDSLGFSIADRDELYDRNIMVHTSFISFKEYNSLLGINSVDKYIEYGGTLKMENMGFDDNDFSSDNVSFFDDESTRKYIDSSISRNIQHSLKNDNFGNNFNQLTDLYDNNELTNIINRFVESMNHQFLLKTVQQSFRSHDLGSAKQLLLHEYPSPVSQVLYDIDENKVTEILKKIIDIKESSETKVKVTQIHLDKIKQYLYRLDLIVNLKVKYESKGDGDITVFTQPGMRYSIAKALVYSLINDEYFSSLQEKVKDYICSKILEDVKGRMLEDIVLLETYKAADKHQHVFKFKFDNNGEYDMIIYNDITNTCKIYEVKHSLKDNVNQIKYLNDKTCNDIISGIYGNIDGKFVLYRGQDKKINGIDYINVEEYLKNL